MGINLITSMGLRLETNTRNTVSELSGIAWDEDQNMLYAISDEGVLYHLKLAFEKGRLLNVAVENAFLLLGKNKKPLRGKWKDSEGLSLVNGNNAKPGDSELLISFEKKPRVVRYTTKGEYIGEIRLPKKLWRKKNYRHKNKALESVTLHPQEGIITATEFPLKKHSIKHQTLYSAKGKEWHFQAASAEKSAVTGLETLPDGNILVLERAWAGIKKPVVISLSEVKLNQCDANRECQKNTIATMSTNDGWMLDNFEGLTHFRNNQYLMVSDDNEHPLQSTVLVLFEIKPDSGHHY
jgi:hypothetical protein